MKNKAVFKFNGGSLALLCSGCSVIIKRGFEFTAQELEACKGKLYPPKQYCDKCKNKYENNIS